MAKAPATRSRNKNVEDAEIIEVNGQRMVRRGNVFVPDGDADPELFDATPEEQDLLAPALQGVLTELGAADDDAKVIVSRLESQSGVKRSVYLFEVHPNDFRIQDLQEAYGAGDYSIKVFGKQPGTNYKVIHANKRISVGATLEQAREKRLPVPPQTDVARSVAEALAPIMAAQTQMLAKLATPGAQPSRKEIIEEMTALAGLFKGNAPAANPLGDLQAIMTLMKAAKGDGDTSDPETAPFATINKAIEVFGGMIANRGASAAQPAALAAPVAATASAQPTQTEDEKMNLIQRGALAGQLAILVNAASADSDPDFYATLIYEQAPDEVITKLEAENWFEELCKLDQRFSAYKPWCEKVRAAVIAALAEVTEADSPVGHNLTSGSEAATVKVNGENPAGPGAGKPS